MPFFTTHCVCIHIIYTKTLTLALLFIWWVFLFSLLSVYCGSRERRLNCDNETTTPPLENNESRSGFWARRVWRLWEAIVRTTLPKILAETPFERWIRANELARSLAGYGAVFFDNFFFEPRVQAWLHFKFCHCDFIDASENLCKCSGGLPKFWQLSLSNIF